MCSIRRNLAEVIVVPTVWPWHTLPSSLQKFNCSAAIQLSWMINISICRRVFFWRIPTEKRYRLWTYPFTFLSWVRIRTNIDTSVVTPAFRKYPKSVIDWGLILKLKSYPFCLAKSIYLITVIPEDHLAKVGPSAKVARYLSDLIISRNISSGYNCFLLMPSRINLVFYRTSNGNI